MASIACLAITVYVVYAMISDAKHKKEKPAPEPVPEPEPEEELDDEEVIIDVPEEILEDIVIAEDCTGVLVVDVTWREHEGKNRTYRYSPEDLDVKKGDRVLVPTFDRHRNRNIVRHAKVSSDKYYIDPAELKFHLKRIIQIETDAPHN